MIVAASRRRETSAWFRVRLEAGFGPVKVRAKNHCGQATKSVWGMSWRQKAEGRGRLRKVRGSCQTSVDPGIPELTRGTETSQYPVEKKETSIS
jgi:hypothetical protein